ncbi:type II toxin-antitoxin system antitoxin SocA domain-containing protein [Ligilactobacillus sp. Marseille-Q7487]|uniref:type II toxin-antitoxin system antitoxin SocA domain-containing protein n=1 Tax=Ligilactobacillus sp. Marseille-Q7487 TaxID=3022128 RepID=UPI0024A8CDAD|nr:type II toxin-antitoxin system antitoxin SocA domain-containing protein [Ligilactobacillus sp. Marseille-Q7487]
MEHKIFCPTCRTVKPYELGKETVTEEIRGKEYHFEITIAVCRCCGEEVNPHGLIDKNIKEIDEQYRKAEDLITVPEIESLLVIYDLGKAPLGKALGFGEVTLSRYLEGQIPSKRYSDIMKLALSSPSYFEKLLIKNKAKISKNAYNKAKKQILDLEKVDSLSDEIRGVIGYLFDKLEEITPLMLQKMLYFTQAFYLARYDEQFFKEDCEAWVHGPVYREVYDIFKEFSYNPIESPVFIMFSQQKEKLTLQQKELIDCLVGTFGIYGAKILESITHVEEPWMKAREGYHDNSRATEIITKENIKNYYRKVAQKYDLANSEEIRKYIHQCLKRANIKY